MYQSASSAWSVILYYVCKMYSPPPTENVFHFMLSRTNFLAWAISFSAGEYIFPVQKAHFCMECFPLYTKCWILHGKCFILDGKHFVLLKNVSFCSGNVFCKGQFVFPKKIKVYSVRKTIVQKLIFCRKNVLSYMGNVLTCTETAWSGTGIVFAWMKNALSSIEKALSNRKNIFFCIEMFHPVGKLLYHLLNVELIWTIDPTFIHHLKKKINT